MWELCVGLEIHAQIISASKLFSRSPASLGGVLSARWPEHTLLQPNACVSLFDAAIPGTLPVLNREAVDQAIRSGLALGGRVNRRSVFDRKHYFYFDMPLGYQITQQTDPLVTGGALSLQLPEDDAPVVVRINRVQLEQDSGKSIHDLLPDGTVVDLNRAGVALMEFVTEPDMRSAAEAAAFVRKLAHLLRHIRVCDGNMAQGSLRCDVNVSVRREGERAFGERVEIKNLNSIRNVARAVDAEAARQVEQLERGEGPVARDTRSFNAAAGCTERLRSKETALDYRFFPDPDLPPLLLEDGRVEQLRAQLPELPDATVERLRAAYGLSPYVSSVLVGEVGATDFFEAAAREAAGVPPDAVANWLTNDLFSHLKEFAPDGELLARCALPPRHLGRLAQLVHAGQLSSKMGKQVLADMVGAVHGGAPEADAQPDAIVQRLGLRMNSDAAQLRAICAEVLDSAVGRKAVKKYRAGNVRVVGGLVGAVMKATAGQANPQLATAVVEEMVAQRAAQADGGGPAEA